MTGDSSSSNDRQIKYGIGRRLLINSVIVPDSPPSPNEQVNYSDPVVNKRTKQNKATPRMLRNILPPRVDTGITPPRTPVRECQRQSAAPCIDQHESNIRQTIDGDIHAGIDGPGNFTAASETAAAFGNSNTSLNLTFTYQSSNNGKAQRQNTRPNEASTQNTHYTMRKGTGLETSSSSSRDRERIDPSGSMPVGGITHAGRGGGALGREVENTKNNDTDKRSSSRYYQETVSPATTFSHHQALNYNDITKNNDEDKRDNTASGFKFPASTHDNKLSSFQKTGQMEEPVSTSTSASAARNVSIAEAPYSNQDVFEEHSKLVKDEDLTPTPTGKVQQQVEQHQAPRIAVNDEVAARANNHQRVSSTLSRDSSPTLTAIEPSPPDFRPPSNGNRGHDRTPSQHQQQQQQQQQQHQQQQQQQQQQQHHHHHQQQQQVNNPSQGQHDGQPHKRRSIGDWNFIQTIGAGSMGQVKLAQNRSTEEQCAVKVVPKAHADRKRQDGKKSESDESKDIRTVREASIGKLIHHPYICDLMEVHSMTNHYYMLFEYVSGGQMLDYIIAHGRLKEKQARKFARSIGSALDYLHHNSIVHRDLKIENILISKDGDIKIIDFGLSNMYSPNALLNTFCGSLYFAAPELLNASPYIGPEVDVWSFGIVLYVLVCGKVPFDDQSMPELHAKIKRGRVEYPNWLSSDCRDLLSRMLVVNSADRASLSEVMYHPWMTKGYDGRADSFVPTRRPITLPLDPEITQEMAGFDFGSQEDVERNLTSIIESADYQRAATNWYKLHDPEEKKSGNANPRPFSFDFYKRRLSFNSDNSPPVSSNDPTNAYHPLCSIYYLVQEKRERERLAKTRIFKPDPAYTHVSSTMYPQPTPPAQSYQQQHRARSKTQGADFAPQGVTYAPPPQTRQYQGHHQSHASEPVNKPNIASNLLRRLSTKRKPVPDQLQLQQPPQQALARSPSMSESPRRRPVPGHGHGQRASQQLPPDFKYPAPPAGSPSSRVNETSAGNSSPSRNRVEPPRSPTKARVPAEGRILTESVQQSKAPDSSQRASATSSSGAQQPRTYHPSARAKSLGHARSASSAAATTGTGGTALRQSMHGAPPQQQQQQQQTRAQPSPQHSHNEQEDTFDEVVLHTPSDSNSRTSSTQGMVQEHGSMPSIEYPKQVFLKGFFSVQSTSTKSLVFIRSDIIRVLSGLGVTYSEIRGGFMCMHRPSVKTSEDDNNQLSVASPPMSPSNHHSGGHWRKLSFGSGLFNGGSASGGSASGHRRRPTAESSNIFDNSDMSAESMGYSQGASATNAVTAGASDMLGNTGEKTSGTTVPRTPLRFEIYIVKVPLLSLHGVQFKKLTGNSWHYKNLATKILGELRL